MRKCGDCTVCCFVGGVPELKKGPHSFCKYECNGCSIFGQPKRPSVCNKFQCSWMLGIGNDEDRPDKSGIMLSLNKLNGGTWGFAIETMEKSIMGSGKSILIAMSKKIEFPIIIVLHKSKPPNDTGDLVVIKSSIKHRALKIIDEKTHDLSENIKIYGLVK